ncbi:MAG: outer membrane protein assembly factor BamA, partial [Candidatus Thioglobus sp.]|nr:outer membrane protein assembly factor BamA [Candidatus Thioglobus sp.]MBT6022099.1 outer membrane protein assembly factor BamA [Candidatus Thioglobus sp.]
MKKSLLKILVSASIISSSVALADPIKSIEILGLSSISRGTVLSYLPVETGDDYNNQVSGQIIRDLYKTNFFKDIEVSQKDSILKINLQENPHIKYIDVLNYSDKVIDEERLTQILKNMDLSQGKIFNKRQLNKLIEQLESTYVSKGYYGIKITKKIETDAQNRVGIELDVHEGEVARIGSMKITGGNIHDEDDLLDLFEIGEADFFIINYFTEKDHYSKVALDAGVEAMKSLYV